MLEQCYRHASVYVERLLVDFIDDQRECKHAPQSSFN